MKVEVLVVSKDIPLWMNGRVFEIKEVRYDEPMLRNGYYTGPARLVAFTTSKPTLVWPRWWHKLGKKLGWRWLKQLGDWD